jgi:hypothetical protein
VKAKTVWEDIKLEKEKWITEDIDIEKPNIARIYDYLLGGYHNFEIDRATAEGVLKVYPYMKPAAIAVRAYLRRSVHFLTERGIEQFLDIGSGLPTVGNVHELVQEANPAARVVYVDNDPVAVTHSRAMLEDNKYAEAILGDVARPGEILNHGVVKEMLDFERPVALLLHTVLHFIMDDEEAYSAVKAYSDSLVAGSYLSVSHMSYDDLPEDMEKEIREFYKENQIKIRVRTYDQIKHFFGDFEMVEPGLVRNPLWRPEGPNDFLLEAPERVISWAGVGCKH